jgi:hypothetical protein
VCTTSLQFPKFPSVPLPGEVRISSLIFTAALSCAPKCACLFLGLLPPASGLCSASSFFRSSPQVVLGAAGIWFVVACALRRFSSVFVFSAGPLLSPLSPRMSLNCAAKVSTSLLPPILFGSLPCSVLFSCARLSLVRDLAHVWTQAPICVLSFLCQIQLPVFIAHDFLFGKSSAKAVYSPRDFLFS